MRRTYIRFIEVSGRKIGDRLPFVSTIGERVIPSRGDRILRDNSVFTVQEIIWSYGHEGEITEVEIHAFKTGT